LLSLLAIALGFALAAAPAMVIAQSPQPSPVPTEEPATEPPATAAPTAAPESPSATEAPTEQPATQAPETEAPTGSPAATQPAATATATPGGQPQAGVPPEVAAAGDEWPLPNGTYTSHRAASNSSIDSTNVDQLGVAWTYAIETQSASGFGALATNPLILDGVVYFQDLTSNIHAVNLETGEELWQTDYNVDQLGPNGVAVGYGKVFAVKGLSEIVALNATDGTEVWSRDLRTQNETEGVTIQPLVWDGKVYASTVPGTSNDDFYQGGVAGILYTLDQETGEIVWSFNTVEPPDLWGNPEVNSGGGAWYPPSVDQRNGRVYYGTGNPGPFPGTEEFPSGASRPGRNLYTNSMLALNGDNGNLLWFRQARPHDLYDLDFQLSPILARVEIDGTPRAIAIGAGKNGELFGLDRRNGDVLWRTRVGLHQNTTVNPIPETGITVYPGALGGVETPMAYADGVVYAAYLNASTTYSPSGILQFDVGTGRSRVVAINAATGNVVWETPEYDVLNVGSVTVVNDLVFTALYDGRIIALDRLTGGEVWSVQAPAGINGWMAVAGDTILVPAGVGAAPQLIALKVGATNPMPSPPPAPSPSPDTGPGASPAGSPAGSPVGNVLTLTTAADNPLSFGETELSAPANTEVTIRYDNQSSVPHNVAVFPGTEPSGDPIGRTEVETGPVVQELVFTTPDPGSYLYLCEVHPETMRGTLTVE
jgi:outer membrane protein assembly factor BamB/plastocyanin